MFNWLKKSEKKKTKSEILESLAWTHENSMRKLDNMKWYSKVWFIVKHGIFKVPLRQPLCRSRFNPLSGYGLDIFKLFPNVFTKDRIKFHKEFSLDKSSEHLTVKKVGEIWEMEKK